MTSRLALAPVVFTLVALTACQDYNAGMQRSLARADETSALASLHSIIAAERAYSLSNGGEYGTFQQLVDAGLLDSRFSSGKPAKDYVIVLNVTPKSESSPEGSYACNADPEQAGERAGRHFYIDSTSGLIHANDTQPATGADKALQ